MRESIERAKGRLRRALHLPTSAKVTTPKGIIYASVEEALASFEETTKLATRPTTRAQTSLSVHPADPANQVKPQFARKLRTRLSNRHSIYNLFHNPPLSSEPGTDITATESKNLTLHYQLQSNSVFLNLPAEIRNEIYHLLLPDVTNLRDVTGLVCACHQIRQELSSMIVAETKPIIEGVKRLSVIRRQTYDSEWADSFIHTPTVSTHTSLLNINLTIPIASHILPRIKLSPVTFVTACSDLKNILRLHVPYVTIFAPITLDTDEDLADPWTRHRFLNSCYESFRRLEEEQDSGFNAQHVIYELGREKWEGQTWAHPPVIAFVKRKNEQGEVAYEFMGHDPRSELSDYEGVKWDSTGVHELYVVVGKSQQATMGGQ
jgi:hypothetical protein